MRYTLKKVLLVLLLTNAVCWCFAQQAATDQYKFSLAPASPEAAMLFKFSDIPVSQYTGTPDVVIPIQKLSPFPNFNFDISLSYHGSGNRVNEIPSYVGLGWLLNAGGMISRKTMGLPDDTDVGQGFLKLRQDHTYSELAPASEATWPMMSSGCWDAEPDEFYFSVNGYSGKFAFDWSTATNIKISSKAPVRITFAQGNANSNAITQWQLTTPDGYQYTFSALEQTLNRSSYTGLGTCRPTGVYTTSWYLTQIVNLNNSNEHIDLTYQGYTLDYDWIYIESATFGPGGCGCSPSFGTFSSTANRSWVSGLRLNQVKIYPNNITVDFIANNDRQDLSSTYQTFNTNNKTLDFIQFSYNGGNLVEKYALNYFYQGNRLMLQSIQKFGADGSTEPPHQFTYNGTSLPDRTSKSVDAWGYFNGKNNTTLLPSYVNTLSAIPFVFNGADRSPDVNYGKAQVLEKIIYPTGGRTELDYEGHDYSYVQNATVASQGQYQVKDMTQMATSIGNGPVSTWQTSTTDFTIPGNATDQVPVFISISSASFSCTGSDGNYFCLGGAYLPKAHIYKWNTITSQYDQLLGYLQGPAGPGVTVNYSKQDAYTPGQYRLVTEADRTGLNPANAYDYISIYINYKAPDLTQPVVYKKAGGLRVKEIRHYDNFSTQPRVTKYQYIAAATNMSSGVINGEVRYTDGGTNLGSCSDGNSATCLFINLVGSGNVIFGETNGSFIGYREVTAFETGNGRTVSKFYSQYESPDIVNDQKPYGYPVSNSHRTGLPYDVSVYNQAGVLVKQDLYEYGYSDSSVNSIRVSKGNTLCNYAISPGGPSVTECPWDPNNFPMYYSWWYGPVRMGFAQLTKQSTYQDGVWLEKNFSYNSNLQLLVQENYKNKGATSNILTTTYKHPGDESQMSGLTTGQLNAISSLKGQNRYLITLEKTELKDQNILKTTRFNYRTFDNGQVNQESIAESFRNQSLEPRLGINKYDANSNILDQNKTGGFHYAYVYGYSWNYPIAQVLNASYADVAYTSFEDDLKGNWTYSGSPTNDATSPTGNKVYPLLNNNVSIGALDPAKTYVVSYWSKGSPAQVNGTAGVAGRSFNGWTVYEHKIAMPSSGVITITGTANIDELRLFPAGAQMTTFTYSPLVGVTSQCDMNHRITYYNYDGLGRLNNTRDQDGNILKTFEYHYQGQ